MTTLMRNGRDRRSGKPVTGHAIVERVLLVGTRSADHIRASGQSGRIAMGQASIRKQAGYTAAPERFAKRQILLAPRAPSIHGASLHSKTGRIHGCTRTLRKTSDSSCTAGAVHTWPVSTVRRNAAMCLELRDKPTLRRHRKSAVRDPTTTWRVRRSSGIAPCQLQSLAGQEHGRTIPLAEVARGLRETTSKPRPTTPALLSPIVHQENPAANESLC